MAEYPQELVDTIAETIGTHEGWQKPDRTWECSCGKRYGLKVNLDYHMAHAALDAITASRRAIVELPELVDGRYPVTVMGDRREVFVESTKLIRISETVTFFAAETSALAAALLAAVAERGEADQ